MKQEVKEKWVGALRSGEYKQTNFALKCENDFCCLGVLTDLCIKETGIGRWDDTIYVNGKYYNDCTLPETVMKWAELDEDNPLVVVNKVDEPLSYVNDFLNKSFKQIADLIEEQL